MRRLRKKAASLMKRAGKIKKKPKFDLGKLKQEIVA